MRTEAAFTQSSVPSPHHSYCPAKNTGSPDALSTIEPYANIWPLSSCACRVKKPSDAASTLGKSAATELCVIDFGASCTNAVASVWPFASSSNTVTPVVTSASFTKPTFERNAKSERSPGTNAPARNAATGSIDCPYVPPPSTVVYVRLVTTGAVPLFHVPSSAPLPLVRPNAESTSASTIVRQPATVYCRDGAFRLSGPAARCARGRACGS